MAERNYTYSNAGVTAQKFSELSSGLEQMIQGIGQVSGDIYKRDKAKKESWKSIISNSIMDRGDRLIASLPNENRAGRHTERYQEVADGDWSNITQTQYLAYLAGCSEDFVEEFLASEEGQRLRSVYNAQVQDMIRIGEDTNFKVDYQADAELNIRKGMAEGKTFDEIMNKNATLYKDRDPSSWDAGGIYNPEDPQNRLAFANLYAMEYFKAHAEDYVSDHHGYMETLDYANSMYSEFLDGVIKNPDSETSVLMNKSKEDWDNFLRSKDGIPKYQQDKADRSSDIQIKANDYIFGIEEKGKKVGQSDIDIFIATNGLNVENPFDRGVIANMYKQAETWNTTLLSTEAFEVINKLGGYEKLSEAGVLNSESSMTEEPTLVSKDGYSLTGGKWQQPSLSAGLDAIYKQVATGEAGAVSTYYTPLIDKICEEYGITSDETRYALAVTLNKYGKDYADTTLKINDNRAMSIATATGMTEAEKRRNIDAMKNTCSAEGYEAAVKAINFQFSDEAAWVRTNLEEKFKTEFGNDGKAFYNEMVKGDINFEERLQQWLLTHEASQENLEGFVDSQMDLFRKDGAIRTATESMDSIFLDTFNATYSDSVFGGATDPTEIYVQIKNGDYHTWEDAEIQSMIQKTISAEWEGNTPQSMDYDRYREMASTQRYGKSFDELTPTQKNRIEVNTFEACMDACVVRVLDNSFGFKRRGIKTKQVNVPGYGPGLLSSGGYVYVMANPHTLAVGEMEDGFFIGKLDMSKAENRELFRAENETATIDDTFSLNFQYYQTDYRPKPMKHGVVIDQYEPSNYATGETGGEFTLKPTSAASSNEYNPKQMPEPEEKKGTPTPSNYITGNSSKPYSSMPVSAAANHTPTKKEEEEGIEMMPDRYYPGDKVDPWEDPALNVILNKLDELITLQV